MSTRRFLAIMLCIPLFGGVLMVGIIAPLLTAAERRCGLEPHRWREPAQTWVDLVADLEPFPYLAGKMTRCRS